VVALLDAIVDLVPPPHARPAFKGTVPTSKVGATPAPTERAPSMDAPTAAFVFKTTWDQHAGLTSWVRVLSGSLKPDSTMLNAQTGNTERLGKILHGVGKDMKQVDVATAGDIVALPKLKATRTTHTLSDEKHPVVYAFPALPPPLFSRGVKFEAKGGEDKVATALHRLSEEDPGLIVGQDEMTREMLVSGLGSLHLEITVERIRRRIGIDCRLGPPHIAYKETITRKVTGIEGKHKKQSGGHGQFGVCYIDMEPNPRGAGFLFEDAIVGGSIPRQFIPSVEKGIVKSMARGFLAGFPMIDVKVRVYDGKYHDVDSSDAAFQMAGSKAFKAAAAQCQPVILEPIVKLQVTTPQSTTGDVIGDINSRRGRILGTDSVDEQTIVNAYVPLSEVLEYESKLKSMTQGKATFSMSVSHLEICPPIVQDKVVKDSGFKHADEDE
jgi:elongation factor G